MNKIALHCVVIFVVFLNIGINLFGQDIIPRNKIKVVVKAIVNKDSTVNFNFKYTLTNLPESVQNVWDFDIIFTFAKQKILKIYNSPGWQTPVIPDDGPPYWISWGVFGDAQLKPGQSANNFGLLTDNLPGITDFYAEGYAPLPSFPEGMATDSIPGYDDLTPYGPGVVGKTIGPVAVPDPFIHINFLDTLIIYTTQSRTLGWIKDDATTNKYLCYFTSAKTSLQNNDSSGACITLKKVLQDVNVDSTANPATQTAGKLTSEAYALLRYNTEYLLAKLPQQTAFTVAELLDSLRARLQQCFVQNQIGDKNFVNELDNGLTNAQKNLSKGDSVNCRKEVIKFQDKLQKEYEKKPKDKRFVTEEGYRLLNDRAQAIINRLPVKK